MFDNSNFHTGFTGVFLYPVFSFTETVLSMPVFSFTGTVLSIYLCLVLQGLFYLFFVCIRQPPSEQKLLRDFAAL